MFSQATVRRLPTQSRSRHFGGVSEKKTRSDHVSGNALAARNNKDYGQGNGSQSFCKVLRIEGRGVGGGGLCTQAIKVPPIETLMQGCLKKSRKSDYRL